jgi:hypothetical protein
LTGQRIRPPSLVEISPISQELLKNGQVLQLVSTWTDPGVFKGSHTYEYRYNRMPRDYDGRG